jgi:hypothetical protein
MSTWGTVQAGARAPVPRLYGSGRLAFSPLTVLRGRGRIFPAPARGDPAPRGRARLRRGLRLMDGPGHPEPQAAVWLRQWRSIHLPSARTGLADQSPGAKVVRPAGRSTLTRGLCPATRRVADGERMNPHSESARSRECQETASTRATRTRAMPSACQNGARTGNTEHEPDTRQTGTDPGERQLVTDHETTL